MISKWMERMNSLQTEQLVYNILVFSLVRIPISRRDYKDSMDAITSKVTT
jgi:hypothetical protein